MTLLQKSPPAGHPNGSASLQTAVPYEHLPQSTQQPVPVTSAVVGSSFNELPSTNPFSPNFSPRPAPSPAGQHASAAQLFSPVSPINDPRLIGRVSQPHLHSTEPQRPNGNKKNVNLQRLNGKPYPSADHADKGPKHVKVAKDMFDGALPPVYKRQASDPTRPGDVALAMSNARECLSCGKKCAEGGSCTHCGKRKSSEPGDRDANGSGHSRTVSTGVNSERSIASSSTAVQSSSSAAGTQPSCTKCGRHRRPGSLDAPNVPATNPAQPGVRFQQAGLSIQPNSAGHHNPVYPQIDIIPPSATTYRRTNTVPSPFTPYGEESPLVSPPRKTESRGFRNNSIVRSLSRRLSRKEKEKDKSSAPLPSQQLATSQNQTSEQSAGRLINMISSAMQDPSAGRDQQYAKVAVEEPDRPGTPFSFVGERDESDTFDKKDDRDKGGNGEYFPNQEDRLDVIPRPKSADPHHGRHLAPEDAERPQITRFKSLRVGVNRVNQSISRSQSLKRIGSVKQAHHAWYVDGSDENSVPVF
ncbi:uncharacterized protein A1O9_09100 [Exophiala aquamarina CBS 119918]|uniref:Uncharacterized protein n=1 Tax=Exophiala aquamarina CBS 119918 TaxID=1182545 RepID=A0A072P5V4_9EURO|nr:uncharacterized protein A1O9_09100 [Exophiala aquamarina CBS 119918]KEF54658.1 hypothetical protein A1O9_09100 [Exophiala aquamarina CBS 119918]